MAEENENEGESKPAVKSQSTGKSPLVVVLLLINSIVIGLVGYQQFQFMKTEAEKPDVGQLIKQYMDERGSDESQEELAVEAKDEGKLLPLEGFTVNLAQGDGPRRYLRMKTVLKFNKDSEVEEFQARQPQIRDAIISILNSKKPEDLLQREGKLFLKEEIKNAVNSFLINGAVIDVFYVGFQIN
ncbi:MAG: flagellar basal body-associated FliL family protein [Halobacteriovoraceae bacterium]|nr:flagellar basal body-associated FliL family protein [Halobacteriovoraceae bacterium]MCB9094205.1 flagellar basal body-associated FliL family protein [Halobacteriovoraceae bacterium]